MGETPAATVATGSEAVISQGLDAALSSAEGPQAAAPAPVAEPQHSAQPPLQEPPQTGEDAGSRVDPFWERARTGKVTPNDREMIERWRRDAESAKTLKAEVEQHKKTSTEYQDLKSRVRRMAAEHERGVEFFDTHSLEETMAAIHTARSKPQGEPTQGRSQADPERAALRAKIDAIEMRQREEDFKRDLKTNMDKMADLAPEVRAYLESDEIPGKLYLFNGTDLSEFIKERLDKLTSVFTSWQAHRQAADATKAKEKAQRASPGGPPKEQPRRNPVTQQFESKDVTQLLNEATDSALEKVFGEESAA